MKFRVEVGGFVYTFSKREDCFVGKFRLRNLIIHAKNEDEAKEKARNKFVDLSQQKVGNMCETSDYQVDNIEVIN